MEEYGALIEDPLCSTSSLSILRLERGTLESPAVTTLLAQHPNITHLLLQRSTLDDPILRCIEERMDNLASLMIQIDDRTTLQVIERLVKIRAERGRPLHTLCIAGTPSMESQLCIQSHVQVLL